MTSPNLEARSRLTAAKKTVDVTEARLRAAKTIKDYVELEGVLDRATRALRSAERDVALESASADFRARLRQSTRELTADPAGEGT